MSAKVYSSRKPRLLTSTGRECLLARCAFVKFLSVSREDPPFGTRTSVETLLFERKASCALRSTSGPLGTWPFWLAFPLCAVNTGTSAARWLSDHLSEVPQKDACTARQLSK